MHSKDHSDQETDFFIFKKKLPDCFELFKVTRSSVRKGEEKNPSAAFHVYFLYRCLPANSPPPPVQGTTLAPLRAHCGRVREQETKKGARKGFVGGGNRYPPWHRDVTG